MLRLLTSSRTSAIAVECGACSLRAVQLRKDRSWHIHHWLNIEQEPTTAELPKTDYADQVRLGFGAGTFSGCRAALLVGPPEVEYKLIEVPPAVLERSQPEIRAALEFELDRQMPWPMAESEIAVWPVQPGATSSANAMVLASRSPAIQPFLKPLEENGIECLRADVLPHAMIRLCNSLYDERKSPIANSLWGVLDMGFRSCRLYLIHAGTLVYARVLRGGGREMTETLARALHVEFRIAEQYKRIYGIHQTERGFRALAGGLSKISEESLPGVLYAVLRSTIETLASEIERSCRFALGRLPGIAAGPLHLVGGGARLQGFSAALADKLGLPVVVPQPAGDLKDIARTAGEDAHPVAQPPLFTVLAPCIGLALMEADA